MSGLTMVVMTTICGVVWGGFVLLVRTAARCEAEKSRTESVL